MFISSIALEVFGSCFSFRFVLIEHKVILSNLSPDLVAIFTSGGCESLLMGLSPPPSLLVQEFYANIYDARGFLFRVFLRSTTVRTTTDVISRTLHISRVIHFLFFCLSADILSVDFLIWSTLFNNPLGGGPTTTRTEPLPTNCQILLHIVCTKEEGFG